MVLQRRRAAATRPGAAGSRRREPDLNDRPTQLGGGAAGVHWEVRAVALAAVVVGWE